MLTATIPDTPEAEPGAAPISNSIHRPDSTPLRREWVRPVVEYTTALILFVLALPVIALAGLLVCLTSVGPAIYTQTRVGRSGRVYTIYKLRTMQHNCEATTGARWATRCDPRVTWFGRFLRATHLDELPQLWNVLRGDMRLIGPRPERPEIVAVLEASVPDYRSRLVVRPGVTGLAQILLPADTAIDCVRRKLELDRAYIAGQGWGMDARILVGTVLYLAGLRADRIARCLGLPAPPPPTGDVG